MFLVGLARQDLQAPGVHRHGERNGVSFITRLQGLDAGDEHLVGHDAAGREHLRATDGQSFRVLGDHAGGQEFVRLLMGGLRPIGLGIDDHVGQVELVVPGMAVIAGKRAGAFLVVVFEDVQPHVHAGDAGGDVVRGAAEKPAVQLGPGLQRLAPLDQLGVASGELPDPVRAPRAVRRPERHQVEIGPPALEIVEFSDGCDGIAERRMGGDVPDDPAVQVDLPTVPQSLDVLFAGLDHLASLPAGTQRPAIASSGWRAARGAPARRSASRRRSCPCRRSTGNDP